MFPRLEVLQDKQPLKVWQVQDSVLGWVHCLGLRRVTNKLKSFVVR